MTNFDLPAPLSFDPLLIHQGLKNGVCMGNCPGYKSVLKRIPKSTENCVEIILFKIIQKILVLKLSTSCFTSFKKIFIGLICLINYDESIASWRTAVFFKWCISDAFSKTLFRRFVFFNHIKIIYRFRPSSLSTHSFSACF